MINMSKVKAIENANLDLAQTEFKPNDYSLLSLRVAMKSYFSTYKAVRYTQALSYDSKMKPAAVVDQDLMPMAYVVSYFETIIHFQHFFELFCKGILAIEHPLLAHRVPEKPKLLLKVLKNEALTAEELNNVSMVEMSQALKVLRVVLKDERSNTFHQYGFLSKPIDDLETLNGLRNRILHGGKHVLSYAELDDLIVHKILPLIAKIEKLPIFRLNSRLWRYKPLHCNIDPISELVERANNSWEKIALLKELGRAAYENPMRPTVEPESPSRLMSSNTFQNRQFSKIAKAKAEAYVETHNSPYTTCPVCGNDTMNVFYDNNEICDPQKPDEIIGFESYPYSTECQCCSLELSPEIWAKSTHGYKGIDPEEDNNEQE